MSVFNPLTGEYGSQLFAAIGKWKDLNLESADVQFVFESNGECERVPAHKAHLMAASDVFAAMFNGAWKEDKEVKIAKVSAAAFKEFLQFFYVGRVTLTMENVAEVLNLGEMYNVAECLVVCSKFFKNNLNADNACRIYELAILFNQRSLKRLCEVFIALNTNAVLKSTGFLSCDQKVIVKILGLNSLSCTEVELFEACMSWVKAASKRNILSRKLVQNHLGDSVHKIRFGSMPIQAFAALIPTYGRIFSVDECHEIMQIFTNPTFQPRILDGNRVARCDSKEPWLRAIDNEIRCKRLFSNVLSDTPHQIRKLERTTFSTNESLLLWGFDCVNLLERFRDQYYCRFEKIPTNVTIVEISDSNGEAVLYNGNAALNRKNGISLTKPIIVKPGFMYEIRLEQTPPENCYTAVFMKSMVELESGIIVQFHRDPEHDPAVANEIIHTLFFE